MFFREDETKICVNGVRQRRRTWRSALESACFSVATEGVGVCVEWCLCPRVTRWVRNYKLFRFVQVSE